MFWDRLVQYPGRVKLTDPATGNYILRDTERAEGDITDEGTTLNSAGFDEALKSYFDIGQDNAELIGNALSTTRTLATGFSGEVRYGKLGDFVIVHVQVATTQARTKRNMTSTTIPTAMRPTADILEGIRGNDRKTIKLLTTGYVYLNFDAGNGEQIFCDFMYRR